MDPGQLVSEKLLARARSLRHGQSCPEGVLWSLLRDRGMLGLKFRRQHPIGPFIADFYCDELRWVIEVDGGQHNTDQARAYDVRRSDFLAIRGVTVTRFWSSEVMDEIEGVMHRFVEVAGRLKRRAGGSTLTPALSQREREEDGQVLSQRQKEEGGSSPLPERE
ncbi:MAG: endonuclease domain-containing protein [Planctomycetaceae bacterium]